MVSENKYKLLVILTYIFLFANPNCTPKTHNVAVIAGSMWCKNDYHYVESITNFMNKTDEIGIV